MSNPIGATQETTNYLVPSSGGTHAVPVSGIFAAAPFLVDWRQFSVDNFPFQPQGVFVDNTQGTGTLTITIAPLGWNVNVPAGSQAQAQFPAPDGQTCTITGLGQATCIFVDFPVLPSNGAVTIIGTANVNVVSPNPLPVLPAVNNGGLPYQVQLILSPSTPTYSGALTGAVVTTGNLAMPANTFLRKLVLTLTGDATLAVAGPEVITVTLNAVQIYKQTIHLGIAVGTGPELWSKVLDWQEVGLSCGAAGNLVVTIGTALATGTLEVNAYPA